METLPDELRIRILGNLSARQLARLGEINREFYNLSRDEPLWSRLTNERFGNVDQNGSWFQTYADLSRRVYVVLAVSKRSDMNGNFFRLIGVYYDINESMINDIVDFIDAPGYLGDYDEYFEREYPDTRITDANFNELYFDTLLKTYIREKVSDREAIQLNGGAKYGGWTIVAEPQVIKI